MRRGPTLSVIHRTVSLADLIQLHMDRLTPDLHIVRQMLSASGFVCVRSGPSRSRHPGTSRTKSQSRLGFINVVHFLSSAPPTPTHSSTLQSNIPHTPLELRERPAARQGASSGMSLLSQGARMEGGREREVRPEGPTSVRSTSVRTVATEAVSIITALITAQKGAARLWPSRGHTGI